MTTLPEGITVDQPRWYQWVERNAKPKRRYFPRPPRELTRWQKRGPMTRRDWVRFYNWAAENALPRPEYYPPEEEPEDDCEEVPKRRPKKKKTYQQIMDHLLRLATPKMPRGKYKSPPVPFYPYSPKIFYSKPARHDKGRPFAPPQVPSYFMHHELEDEFWNTLRFPIRGSALSFKPSPHLLELALPRVIRAEKLHCPIPPKPPEIIPRRQRMNRRQWCEHLRRLEYLAKPVYRPFYDDEDNIYYT